MATPKRTSAKSTTKSTPAPRRRAKAKRLFVRNLRHTSVSLRLDNEKKFTLKPRGSRGDIYPIDKEDLNDSIIGLNLGLTIEVIDEDVQAEVVSKQTTNQKAFHPALAGLKNELGQPITEVKVDQEFNQQGVVVGYTDDKAGLVRAPTGGNPAIFSQEPLAKADEIARTAEGPESGLGGLNVVVEPVQRS